MSTRDIVERLQRRRSDKVGTNLAYSVASACALVVRSVRRERCESLCCNEEEGRSRMRVAVAVARQEVRSKYSFALAIANFRNRNIAKPYSSALHTTQEHTIREQMQAPSKALRAVRRDVEILRMCCLPIWRGFAASCVGFHTPCRLPAAAPACVQPASLDFHVALNFTEPRKGSIEH